MKQPLIDETGNPEGYINLAEYDATMMEWPGIAIANIYTGAACVNALTTAVENVVAKHPILGGRLVKVPKTQAASGFAVRLLPGVSGVPIRVFNLSADEEAQASKVTPKSMVADFWSSQSICVELFDKCLPGKVTVDQDMPLMTVVIGVGKSLFSLGISLSHAIADGWSYYRVCELISAELSNTTVSMTHERVEMDKALAAHTTKVSSWTATKHSMWYPLLFFIRSLSRKLETRAQTTLHFTESDLAKLKAAARNSAPDCPIISGNDCLYSIICNALEGVHSGTYASNLRGKVPDLPHDLFGNCEGVWHFTKSGPEFHAMDTRRSILANGADPGTTMTNLFCSRVYLFTSWAKIQHFVTIPGATLQCHACFSTLEDYSSVLWKTDFAVCYKSSATEYFAVIWHRKSDIPRLQAACAKAGIMHSTQQVDELKEKISKKNEGVITEPKKGGNKMSVVGLFLLGVVAVAAVAVVYRGRMVRDPSIVSPSLT